MFDSPRCNVLIVCSEYDCPESPEDFSKPQVQNRNVETSQMKTPPLSISKIPLVCQSLPNLHA